MTTMRRRAALCAAIGASFAVTHCAGLESGGPFGKFSSSTMLESADRTTDDGGRPAITDASLIGAPGTQVVSWLGAPDAVWSEGGHAMWRYQSGDCLVLLFVDPAERVRQVNILGRDGVTGGAACESAVRDRAGIVAAG